MSHVYIVRHGNTFDRGDIIRRVGGRTDLPLSISGQKQANRLATHLSHIAFGAAYSSDLKRTKQTAEKILNGQPYQIAHMLTEIDYGPDEGQPEDEVVARIGMDALKRWDEDAVPPMDWQVEPDTIRMDWVKFLATCSPHENTLVVTSNGVARFLLDVVKGGQAAPRKLRTGAYGMIALEARGPRLLEWDIRPKG